MTKKQLYIISGCNGAGKTTASYTVLPEILDCKEFVNADEIAKGLSPFQPEKVAFKAGKIMLTRVKELLYHSQNFAFETTLATRSYRNTVLKAQKDNYNVTLVFFWLNSISLAKKRVKIRVAEGGHNIEPEVIARRYIKGISNLFNIYLPIVNEALIFDNSQGKHELIASKDNRDGPIKIINQEKFQLIEDYYERQ
ncbi:MAG: AAA family ATPase [Fibrobacter sp.]|nr:AAA family ATPase [Fibrobacter sp.]